MQRLLSDEWAWPRGSLDQLLKAALFPDDKAALGNLIQWLDRHDIDSATFREHRLLATISNRFGKDISDHRAYPRLRGLRRQLWTKSQIAIREAGPVLKAIANAGVPLLLIKGAARIARDRSAEKGRVAHDIDIVVGPDRIHDAFAILEGCGWQPSSGASSCYLATQLDANQSLNFFSGSFGDIDLHRDAFPSIRDEVDEERLWQAADFANFLGIDVRVPSASYTAALAIAHGSLAAHIHSDWVVDCVYAIGSREFSWPAFSQILDRRRLEVPTSILFSYLSRQIGIDIPSDILRQVAESANKYGPVSRMGYLLQAKPRDDMPKSLHIARWVAKKTRLRHERASRDSRFRQPVFRGKRRLTRLPAKPASSSQYSTSHAIELSTNGLRDEPMFVSILIEMEAPPKSRRIELEVNSKSGHIARLRYRYLLNFGGPVVLKFDGAARFNSADHFATIEARPIRQIRKWEDKETALRFGEIPFRLISFELSRSNT